MKKLLYIALSTFSQTGGIEKVNRTWLKALNNLQEKGEIQVQANVLLDEQADPAFIPATSFSGFKGNKIIFTLNSLFKALRSDTLILSHINLAIIAVLIKRLKPSVKIILHAHGIEVWRPLSNLRRRALKTVDLILAVSQFTAKELQRTHHIDPAKVQVLNNALAPDFKVPGDLSKPESILHRYQLKTTQPTLFTLARLSSAEQYKGYDQVIAIMPELLKTYPDLVYLIGGKADAVEQQRLNQLVEKLGLQTSIKWLGFIPDQELIDHYLLGDVFVMPSKGEGFGISFIEAAACGRPSVAGNSDGSADALLSGVLGKLVNPENTSEIETGINELLGEKFSEIKSKEIQQNCLEAFSFEVYEEKIKKLMMSS